MSKFGDQNYLLNNREREREREEPVGGSYALEV
jgi:hypothetical protein